LGAICFATDGGNKHCLLDRIKDATIEASDWRIRLELQGDLPKAHQLPKPGKATEEISIPFGEETVISFRFPWLNFGNHQPSWEIVHEDGIIGIDLILYKGSPRSFTFDASFPCVIGLALTIHGPEKSSCLQSIQVEPRGSILKFDWEFTPGQRLVLAAPAAPLTEQEIISFVGKAVAGTLPEQRSSFSL
jgi:hypothetical protein